MAETHAMAIIDNIRFNQRGTYDDDISQHSAALERLDRTDTFVAETHAMAIIDDILFTTFSSLRET